MDRYNGQVQYWATKANGFAVELEWSPWYRADKLVTTAAAGHLRTYTHVHQDTRFNFVTISGAGHEVPAYRPGAALTLLTNFVLSDVGTQ